MIFSEISYKNKQIKSEVRFINQQPSMKNTLIHYPEFLFSIVVK